MTGTMEGGLAQKTGVIVGAVSGIGRAIAERISGMVAGVVLVDRDEKVRTVASDLGVMSLVHDVAQEPAEPLAETVHRAIGAPDFLVYCAGIQRRGTVLGLSEPDWHDLEDVNWRGARRAVVDIANLMVAARIPGSIVTITSSSVRAVTNGIVPYSVTKAALEQFTRGLAAELGSHRIRVNAVAPGYVRTGMTRDVLDDPRFMERLIPRIPLGYVAEPAEIAGPVVFLLTDEARYITGAVIPIDGGFTLGAIAPA